jgi:hypothetical protein
MSWLSAVREHTTEDIHFILIETFRPSDHGCYQSRIPFPSAEDLGKMTSVGLRLSPQIWSPLFERAEWGVGPPCKDSLREETNLNYCWERSRMFFRT